MNRGKLDEAIIAECRQWLGTPYQHQSSVKQVGCDCLGLLYGIWRKLYGNEPQQIPSYTPDWGIADRSEHLLAAANRYLTKTDCLDPATVIFFRWRNNLPAKHIGIVVTKNSFIHAYERAGVVETSLNRHWQKRIAGRFNFPEILESN